MRRILLWLIIQGACILTGCSVKESRTLCPCLVCVDMSRFGELHECDDVLFSMVGNSRIEQMKVLMEEYGHKPFEIEVRGRYATTFCAAAGYSDMICRGDTLIARNNSEYPPLWTASDTERCDDDEAEVELVPRKDYALLLFSVKGLGASDDVQYELAIKAGSNGITLSNHSPVKGPYKAIAHKSQVGETFELRVPRQDDYELILEIVSGSSSDVLELGQLMEDYGYDWHKDDLDDIMVSVDFSKPELELKISKWVNYSIDENI